MGRRRAVPDRGTALPSRSRWAAQLAFGGGAAEDALAGATRPTRGLFFSKNFTAIGTVVRAGLAATILPASMVGGGLRRLGRSEGLPDLALTRMGLIHAPGRRTEETKAFAEAIRSTIGAPALQAA